MKLKKFVLVKQGGVTTPQGFVSSGVSANIKKNRKLDLALIVSETPAVAAGTFTTNQIKAAPVHVSMEHLKSDLARAILTNSGNANACTGVQGIGDAKEMTNLAAMMLGCGEKEVFVCSTGRIGRLLPMEKVRRGISRAIKHLTHENGHTTAKAIMTSDTVEKEIAVRFKIGAKTVHLGACAKGAGMIDPTMATMLCFITTDAAIDRKTLNRCLHIAVEQSFNSICVDGDMSTNDTVLMLANGQAKNPILKSYHPELDVFQSALNFVTRELARKIVLDGEGVSKLVTVAIKGAANARAAKMAAEAIARSCLVKTSWAGNDPNWGRLMAALGYSSARVREELVDIYYDGLLVVRNGKQTSYPATKLKRVVSKPHFQITIHLHLGEGEYTLYTSDLTEEYVKLNLSE
ncbi:MAG: bifunctional glutamate N-acetyltransferase/amino-acid acetyltransferase ArgJ [Verrucomicrobiia bacterium]